VQPTHGFSTFSEFLIARGEGVHSLKLAETEPPSDLPVAQSAGNSTMLDTRRMLGGYCIEVTRGPEPPPDEEWDLTEDIDVPSGVEWLTRIARVGHFGIAVSQLTELLPNYAEMLGITRWNGIHFHSLEHSTYRGEQADNAWLLAITDVANFGLELLQGTREPTDYRQTVDRIGEGIHHMLVRRDLSYSDWTALRDWMASMEIGVVMSGRAPGGAEFFYLDTRAALGYLLEVIVARPAAAAVSTPLERFTFDFSTRGDAQHED
jgi:hypothetical protein